MSACVYLPYNTSGACLERHSWHHHSRTSTHGCSTHGCPIQTCSGARCSIYAKALQSCSQSNCVSKNDFFTCTADNTAPASSWCSFSNQFIVPRPLDWSTPATSAQPRYHCDSEAWNASCEMIPALSVYQVSRAPGGSGRYLSGNFY